ncbi:thiol-activated cytolysin family protein [Gemmata sp.]|uniref:thiol-activated cytolysin family protein n=1 Tax=Gemmata sp. TaxID=1914242 RepID=UPI003F720C6A
MLTKFLAATALTAGASVLALAPAQDAPGSPPRPSVTDINKRAERDIAIRKILNATPLDLNALSELSKAQKELPPVPKSTSLRIDENSAHFHTYETVSNSRKIENALLLATPPGLRVGWLVDANEYVRTGEASDIGDLSGYQSKVKLYFRQLWPSTAGKDQLPVEMEVEPTVPAMFNALNKTLAARLRDGKLAMPVQGLQFEFKEATSKTAMAKEIGVSLEASGWGQTLGVSYSEKGEEKSEHKYLYMMIKQDLFTIGLQRQNMGSLFDEQLAPATIGELLGEKRLGVVNELRFGRFAFVSVRTTSDVKKLKKALEVRFSNAAVKASGKLDEESEALLNSTSFTVLIHGGSLPKDDRGKSAVLIANTNVDVAVSTISDFFNKTLIFDESNIPVEIGFSVQDVVTAKQLGKNEVNRHTPFSDTEPQPFQYRLEYVKAEICDQADSGLGEFVTKVAANGRYDKESLVLDGQWEFGEGPLVRGQRTHKSHDVNASKGFQRSKKDLRLEFFQGEQDDEEAASTPQKMKAEWERAKDAGIDDFIYTVRDYDLEAIVKEQFQAGKTSYSETFTVISPRQNKFTFRLEVKIPSKPEEVAKKQEVKAGDK